MQCSPLFQYTYFTFILLIFCSGTAKTQQKQLADRPNVILILTDDQGYGDIGFTGNPYIKTPHLDALKKESASMSNFYVSPVCTPTRASLMTGKFSMRTGVYDTFNGGALMNGNETTIAEVLKAQGYATGIFGKWHLGPAYPLRPSDQGFDESLVHRGGGIGQPGDPANYYRRDSAYFNPFLYQNNQLVPSSGYCTDVFTNAALDFISAQKEKPFFAYLAYNAPHDPLQLPKEYYDRYKDLDFPQNDSSREQIKPEMSEREKEIARKVYGMITNIDDNIGRIMAKLKEEGILDNTIVIFMSDNGPRGGRYNAGLRAQKSSTYDGGVKVPCIIRYPKQIKPGSEVDAITAHIDIVPTLLDMCDLAAPAKWDIDGLSFAPCSREKVLKLLRNAPFMSSGLECCPSATIICLSEKETINW